MTSKLDWLMVNSNTLFVVKKLFEVRPHPIDAETEIIDLDMLKTLIY